MRFILNRKYLTTENLIYLAFISAFLHFVLGAIVMICLGVYILLSGHTRKRIFVHSGTPMLFIFTGYSVTVALVAENYIGFFCAVGFFLLFVISYFVRTEITSDIFQKALDISCSMCWVVFFTVFIEKLSKSHQPNYRCEGLFKWFFNSNYMCSLMAMMAIVCLYKTLMTQKGKPFYILTMTICIVTMYFGGSIFGFIELLVGILALLILFKKRKAVISFLIFSLFAVLILYLVPDIFPRILDSNSTTNNRILIWDSAIQFIKIRPLFGHGFLSYEHLHQLYGSLWENAHHTHNFLFEPILNFGIIGAALFVMFLWSYFEKVAECKSLLRKNRATNLILAISTAVIIHSTVDLTIQWIQTGLFFVLLLAGIGVDEKALNRRIEACLAKSERAKKSNENNFREENENG